jgi:LPS-assembly lipoprotein
MLNKLLLGLCILLLTACGFHLREPVHLAPSLQHLYLETNDPYGELERNIRQYLRASGVIVTATPQESTAVLEILSESTSEQLLSVGSTQQTRQYNLILTVTFIVTTPAGKPLMQPQTVSETQALTVQADQILGGSNEENNLYHQMRSAIVYTMMNRLTSKAAIKSVMDIQQ